MQSVADQSNGGVTRTNDNIKKKVETAITDGDDLPSRRTSRTKSKLDPKPLHLAPRPLRLLCLHGKGSSPVISSMQLQHLGLTEMFEAVHLRGPFCEATPVNLNSSLREIVGEDVFTWMVSGKKETDSLMRSLKFVIKHLRKHGPYDAVYGFSQGAALATVLSSAHLRQKILDELDLNLPFNDPWRFVFVACSANTRMRDILMRRYNMLQETQPKISLPSIHYIGMTDPFKPHSEIYLNVYRTDATLPLYIDAGHEIPAKSITAETHHLSMQWFGRFLANSTVEVGGMPWSGNLLSATTTKDGAFQIHREIQMLSNTSQLYEPLLDVGQLHVGGCGQFAINKIKSSRMSLMNLLRQAPSKKVALHARGMPSLTYGALIDFIHGPGNLMLIGASQESKVAYVVPYGIQSAVSFVAISSQCTCAPLDPNYTEPDFSLAFEQIQPDFVVAFEGIDEKPVQAAAEQFNIRVILTETIADSCGLFRFRNVEGTARNNAANKSALYNDADSDAMILRTSGTTSRPKLVPLKMRSVVSNALGISKNLGLISSDVALNAMPLFHIGGLSANLLSSLAAGASVIIMKQFDADTFVDMLAPQEHKNIPAPTWYSAVPSIHSAVDAVAENRQKNGSFVHSLRFIRSGADKMPHALAQRMEERFECPVVLTYSMTEQMPISQPPTGFSVTRHKPNSVGRPLVASLAIVNPSLRPLPYSERGPDAAPNVGEVCISGDMVVENYAQNPEANNNSFFWMAGMRWFRTGDMGYMDEDGFLFLTGRMKSLIKRGGDQINPIEVEEVLDKFDPIKKCLVFPVPDDTWGELVAVVVILHDLEHRPNRTDFMRQMRRFAMKSSSLTTNKLPEFLVFANDDEVPKTRSGKIMRNNLFKVFGDQCNVEEQQELRSKPVQVHPAFDGLRFVLALAVNYTHIGNFNRTDVDEISKGELPGWGHSRHWCVHTPLFFFVGGFLLANGTGSEVASSKNLIRFYSLRILSLHPMYMLSVLWCLFNFISRCGPSNYIQDFYFERRPVEGEFFVCQATPHEMSYGATVLTTLLTFMFSLQAWPFAIPFSWFLSYYTWFSSIYYFCIILFPFAHKHFHRAQNDIGRLWRLTLYWLVSLYLYMAVFGRVFAFEGAYRQNLYGLFVYLFPLGWLPCFCLGIAGCFLYRHYRPYESGDSWKWGVLTDLISVIYLTMFILYGRLAEETTPDNLNYMEQRVFGAFVSRILHPIAILWFWGIAAGKGMTATLFSNRVMTEYLAPASYNMFLFHQPIAETYYLITRGVWWAYPKPFFWFSPYPFPVTIWEFPIVIGVVISISVMLDKFVNKPLIDGMFSAADAVVRLVNGEKAKVAVADWDESSGSLALVMSVVKSISDSEITAETSLAEAGMTSMMGVVLVSRLNEALASIRSPVEITVTDLSRIDTIEDLADFIDEKAEAAGPVTPATTSSTDGPELV